MGHRIDRTKTALQNFVDLINTVTMYQLTGTEFTYSEPTEYTPEEPDTSNTQILLTATSESGFTGTKAVQYKRLGLGQTKIGSSFTFTVEEGDDRDSVEEKIAIAHNLVLGEFSLVGSIPSPGDTNDSCTLEAASNSLLYFGTCDITLISEEVMPPAEQNVFQLRTRTPNIQYASAYLADVPTATIIGNDGNTATEEWSTSFNSSVTVGNPDSSTVSLSGPGTAADFFTTRQPSTEGPRYWEILIVNIAPELGTFAIGLYGHPFNDFNENLYVGGAPDIGGSATYYESNGVIINNNSFDALGPELVEGDVVGIVVSNPASPNAARFYVNGVFAGAADVTASPVTPIVSQKQIET
jgi:hypothetical protein